MRTLSYRAVDTVKLLIETHRKANVSSNIEQSRQRGQGFTQDRE
jgi:hypothetical protein